MKPRVLIAYAGHKEVGIEQEILQAAGIEVVAAGDIDMPEAIAAYPETCALMVTIQPVSASLMDRMPNCKIICRVGTGMDAIDSEAASARGIWVSNVPDYSIDEVSTHAMALLLALARNLFRQRVTAERGAWRYQTERPLRRLAGQTLGVLGVGRIGSASIRKGQGLGLKVIACDPYVGDDVFTALEAHQVDFETLLRQSDFLTLHVPLTNETWRIINARALVLMKPTAFLINTARGEVIDVEALVAAVASGMIAGAGIDVLAEEPPPPDHPILREEGIIVTPHIGWASIESSHDVRERGAEDVVRVLRGNPPKYPWNEVPSRLAGVSRS